MRWTIVALGLALVLMGCGQGLSSGKAKSLAMDYWRENGVSMDDTGLCEPIAACYAAAECIEPAATEFIQRLDRGIRAMSRTARLQQIVFQFPAFQPIDVRVEELSDRLKDGARVGTTLRERAEFTARVVPSDVLAAYADCPAFAELAASIEQPVRFVARYEGDQRTSGGMVSVEWRLEYLNRNPE